jgi:translation initiation factor 2B subunit (eIF-2B alpha/beta/delta family)
VQPSKISRIELEMRAQVTFRVRKNSHSNTVLGQLRQLMTHYSSVSWNLKKRKGSKTLMWRRKWVGATSQSNKRVSKVLTLNQQGEPLQDPVMQWREIGVKYLTKNRIIRTILKWKTVQELLRHNNNRLRSIVKERQPRFRNLSNQIHVDLLYKNWTKPN